MRRVVYPVASIGLAALLAGCGFGGLFEFGPSRDAWRDQAELACLKSGALPQVALVQQASVTTRGVCGMERPLKVSAVERGEISIQPAATLACPVVLAINDWMEQVQGVAYAHFGVPVVEIKNLASYGCRTMNNQPGASISEHSFGNALDVAAFRFADGREITVKGGWKGAPEEQRFLREVFAAACQRFSTVLGPGSDRFHYDHFHLDLARRASGRTYCNPNPGVAPPNYPSYRGMRMAGAAPQPGPSQPSGPAYSSAPSNDTPPGYGGWPSRVAGSIDAMAAGAVPRPRRLPPASVPLGYAPVN